MGHLLGIWSQWDRIKNRSKEYCSSDGLANTDEPERVLNVPFEWNPNHQFAFELLLHRLTTAPVLQYPDFTKPFIIDTDASTMGFGAILIQEDTEGKRHPIAYVSRTTNIHEKNYSVTELECCALVYALKQFRVYIYWYKVTVITDHQALLALTSGHDLTGKLYRWH